MELQQHFLNNKLLEISYAHQRKNDENVVMKDILEDEDKYHFYIKIKLMEMLPNSKISINRKTVSPQQIFLKYLFSSATKYMVGSGGNHHEIYNLCYLVTPNIDKSLWYYENDLEEKKIITTYCRMTLHDMKNMLQKCPEPSIFMRPGVYNVTTPESFVNVINNQLSNEAKKALNFVPFLREVTIRLNNVKSHGVYYLHGNIELVNPQFYKCM